ncbi:MAG: extracellular solute-binding protein [Mesorhizobium sp.]|uniref:ABC transporter substrate-binding protein n=1 Tax=Mesorhizobium sp. TaxID=1871066 RepID=UPI00120A8706|nr:extracellular solute-binding protein [Mesorhizobium sp.]TIL60572.1 MAG: extracellular solute-binding protein [Mesorhizobium sp.]
MDMSRRNVLKALSALLAAGSLPIGNRAAWAASKSFVWGATAAVSSPNLLEPFTKQSGIEVSTQLFSDPAEVISKLKTGGAGVHLLLDGSYHSRIAYEMGILQPIDDTKLSNLKNIFPEFSNADGLFFEGKRFGVPLNWGTDSVVIRADQVGGTIDDIGALFDEQFAGRIGMPNGLYESLLVAGIYLGVPDPFDMSADELNAAVDLLVKQKPLVRSYWNDIGDLKNQLATGEVIIAWGWQPVMDIRKDGVDLQWIHPKQGEIAWYDASYLTVEADAETSDACMEFIDYTLGDFYGAQLGADTGYRTVSSEAAGKMSEELKESLSIDNVASFLKSANWWTPPKNPNAYQEAWDKVLNS